MVGASLSRHDPYTGRAAAGATAMAWRPLQSDRAHPHAPGATTPRRGAFSSSRLSSPGISLSSSSEAAAADVLETELRTRHGHPVGATCSSHGSMATGSRMLPSLWPPPASPLLPGGHFHESKVFFSHYLPLERNALQRVRLQGGEQAREQQLQRSTSRSHGSALSPKASCSDTTDTDRARHSLRATGTTVRWLATPVASDEEQSAHGVESFAFPAGSPSSLYGARMNPAELSEVRSQLTRGREGRFKANRHVTSMARSSEPVAI